jgi:hypothetical protein
LAKAGLHILVVDRNNVLQTSMGKQCFTLVSDNGSPTRNESYSTASEAKQNEQIEYQAH